MNLGSTFLLSYCDALGNATFPAVDVGTVARLSGASQAIFLCTPWTPRLVADLFEDAGFLLVDADGSADDRYADEWIDPCRDSGGRGGGVLPSA